MRSNNPDVRNPILKLKSVALLKSMPPEVRAAISTLLMELRKDCQANADLCWKRHKAPMAAYWKAAAVYSGHIARAIKP